MGICESSEGCAVLNARLGDSLAATSWSATSRTLRVCGGFRYRSRDATNISIVLRDCQCLWITQLRLFSAQLYFLCAHAYTTILRLALYTLI